MLSSVLGRTRTDLGYDGYSLRFASHTQRSTRSVAQPRTSGVRRIPRSHAPHTPSATAPPRPPPPRLPIHSPRAPAASVRPSMARPGSRRARRPPPPASPAPRAAATPPRPGSASRRRARRVRVQSPSLAAVRRGPAPPPPPPPHPPPETPPVRWPLGAGARSASRPGAGAALSVREIAAALWRMQPPQQAPPPGPGPGTARRSRAQVSMPRDLCQ